MPRDLLSRVEEVRSSRLLGISRKKNLQFEMAPPTKVMGYYWIYTDYSIEELQTCTSSSLKGSINLSLMARLHSDLPNICSLKKDGFSLVYNGIAGSTGVRERLGQHFGDGKGTGALHIKGSSLNDVARWCYSYATISRKEATRRCKEPTAPDVESDYAHAKHVERIWRLTHGWPLLCTQ